MTAKCTTIAALLSTLLAGCSVTPKDPPINVFTAQPVVAHTIQAEGNILSRDEASIYPPREGIVQSLAVELGDRVQKGQLLATLNPDRTQSTLLAELPYKEHQLGLTRERQELEVDIAQQEAEQTLRTAQTEYNAQILDVEAEEQKKRITLDEYRSASENAMYSLLDATTQMLYTQNDALRNYYNYSNHNYYRRREVFYPHDAEAMAFEKNLLDFYTSFSEKSPEGVTEELMQEAIKLGEESRQFYQHMTPSVELTPEIILEIREDIDEATNAIIRNVAEYSASESGLVSAQKKKQELLKAGVKKPLINPESTRKQYDLDIATLQADIGRTRSQAGAARTVYAPFSGTIVKRHVNVGDAIDLWRPIFTLIDDQNFYLQFAVKEQVIALLEPETLVGFSPVHTPALQGQAIVKRIAKAIDPGTSTIQVEADILRSEDHPNLISHMSTYVHIPVPETVNLLEIPKSALVLSKSSQEVWTVTRKRAELTPVTVAFEHGEKAYIHEGLTPDDTVIVQSSSELKPSTRVDAKPLPPKPGLAMLLKREKLQFGSSLAVKLENYLASSALLTERGLLPGRRSRLGRAQTDGLAATDAATNTAGASPPKQTHMIPNTKFQHEDRLDAAREISNTFQFGQELEQELARKKIRLHQLL